MVNYLRTEGNVSCIGLWGRSMGAVTRFLSLTECFHCLVQWDHVVTRLNKNISFDMIYYFALKLESRNCMFLFLGIVYLKVRDF